MKYFIGIDLGKQFSFFVVKDTLGTIIQKMKIFNDSVSLKRALTPYPSGECAAVMEATCNYYWMYQELRALGCKVVLAHPLKTRAIADAKVKNDRLDASILADLLRANLIPQSYIPSERIRGLRELTRQHVRLVRLRTCIKNQCHALLTKLNVHCPHGMTDLFGRKGTAWLRHMILPDVFEFQKEQYLEQIESYNQLVEKTDRKIREQLQYFPEATLLTEIPGIGILGAAMLVAEIGDINRFPSTRQLTSYAGLTPGLYESGQTSHARGLTQEGNPFLRWILCELTHRHIRKPGPLRQFFLRLKGPKGHGKALVATSRKFLAQLYFVLKERNISVFPGYARA